MGGHLTMATPEAHTGEEQPLNPTRTHGAAQDTITTAQEEDEDEDAWKKGFYEETPLPPVLWGWTMNAVLLIFNTWMVHEYAGESKDLKWGDSPVWLTYVIIQLFCMAYSWVTVNYIFPRYPTVCGIPFFLIGFPPAFLIV